MYVSDTPPGDRQTHARTTDPHLGLRFWVQIDGVEVAGFARCSGIVMETAVTEYEEGGLNAMTHKLPGRVRYGNILLQRGLDEGQDLYRWYLRTLDGQSARRNLSIVVYGPVGDQPVRQWDLRAAYPVRWVGPDLTSESGAIAIETLEIAHAGLVLNRS